VVSKQHALRITNKTVVVVTKYGMFQVGYDYFGRRSVLVT